MRLGYSKSKNSIYYYAQKTIRVEGKNKTIIVRRFGPEKDICNTYGVTDAKAWCQEEIRKMNEAEKEDDAVFSIDFSSASDLSLNEQRCFNGGYLFLQEIYYELGLDKICKAIAKKSKFEYNLNSILSRLVYSRILFPCSKKGTYEESFRYIEQPDFDLHQVYRALSVLADNSDYVQSTLYKNSLKLGPRNTGVIYYDCTNYFFEIEEACEDKQYGVSKQHQPLPVVGMGLFMDRDGIPLAYTIYPGNCNEQQTMTPLESKIISDFGLSKFVVCTDAGLSSYANRRFNDVANRAFITTQSIKTLPESEKNWALDPNGWYLAGDAKKARYNLTSLDQEADKDKLFYKSQWIKVIKNGETLEQQLIVSYSIKYKNYLSSVRERQIARACSAIDKGKSALEHKRQSDYRRFVSAVSTTNEGEIAAKKYYALNEDVIANESKYDGFYAVCTNLEDDPQAVVSINKKRWEIEECFRIMKDEFKARPAYLHRKERIRAHFMTCFLALVIYRYLEKKLDYNYTCEQITGCLRDMNFLRFDGKGYIPTYTRTDLTDALHKAFSFTTSKEIIPVPRMRNICSMTKKQST